jgi:hypothetical protein
LNARIEKRWLFAHSNNLLNVTDLDSPKILGGASISDCPRQTTPIRIIGREWAEIGQNSSRSHPEWGLLGK